MAEEKSSNNKVEIRFEEEVEVPLPEEELNKRLPFPLQYLKSAGVPPNYISWLEDNRTYVYIGIGVLIAILIILVLAAAVYYFYFYQQQTNLSFNYGEQVKTTGKIIGPIEIAPGQVWSGSFNSSQVTRPLNEDIYIHQVYFQVLDLLGNVVSQEQVFINYIELLSSSSFSSSSFSSKLQTSEGEPRKIAALREEGSKGTAMKLQTPFVISSSADEEWSINAELVNFWGLGSGATVSVNINYTIVYDLVSANTSDAVDVDLYPLGSSDQWYHSLYDDTNEEVRKIEYDVTWENTGGDLVAYVGYLSPGGLNISMYEVTANNTIYIASSIPQYNSNGYISSQGFGYKEYNITEGTTLKVVAYYDNSFTYTSALAYFAFYGTFDATYPLPSPSFSPSPTASVSPSSSSSPGPSPSISPSSSNTTVPAPPSTY